MKNECGGKGSGWRAYRETTTRVKKSPESPQRDFQTGTVEGQDRKNKNILDRVVRCPGPKGPKWANAGLSKVGGGKELSLSNRKRAGLQENLSKVMIAGVRRKKTRGLIKKDVKSLAKESVSRNLRTSSQGKPAKYVRVRLMDNKEITGKSKTRSR